MADHVLARVRSLVRDGDPNALAVAAGNERTLLVTVSVYDEAQFDVVFGGNLRSTASGSTTRPCTVRKPLSRRQFVLVNDTAEAIAAQNTNITAPQHRRHRNHDGR
jgi:hypothetical protein